MKLTPVTMRNLKEITKSDRNLYQSHFVGLAQIHFKRSANLTKLPSHIVSGL